VEGAWYALEQSGRLLHDAIDLYDRGRYGTAAGIALLGREELGKGRLLLQLCGEATRRTVTEAEVADACEDHVLKQKAAQLAVSISAARDSRLAQLLGLAWSREDTPEVREARKEVENVIQAKVRRTPSNRHDQRMKALYVDLTQDGRWSRPANFPREEAELVILEAMNDYSGLTGNLRAQYGEDPTVFELLRQWPGRPELPPVKWPAS